ncbi:MAG: YgaP family membrane protein [Thermoanaerobaculia bacterium]
MASRLFPTNEHIAERVIRVIVGLGILSLTVIGPKTLWGLIGILPLVTGLIGSCPAYTLLGISTCPMKKAPTQN